MTFDCKVSSYNVQEDAKLAFKQLLASVGMRSDWTWEQAMRLIVTDSRYGAPSYQKPIWCRGDGRDFVALHARDRLSRRSNGETADQCIPQEFSGAFAQPLATLPLCPLHCVT